MVVCTTATLGTLRGGTGAKRTVGPQSGGANHNRHHTPLLQRTITSFPNNGIEVSNYCCIFENSISIPVINDHHE